MGWVGLGWVGLGEEKWTHVHLWFEVLRDLRERTIDAPVSYTQVKTPSVGFVVYLLCNLLL